MDLTATDNTQAPSGCTVISDGHPCELHVKKLHYYSIYCMRNNLLKMCMKHAAVVHRKLIGIAHIELQVIFVAPRDTVLCQSSVTL